MAAAWDTDTTDGSIASGRRDTVGMDIPLHIWFLLFLLFATLLFTHSDRDGVRCLGVWGWSSPLPAFLEVPERG